MSCGVSLPGDKEDIEDGVSRCLDRLRDASTLLYPSLCWNDAETDDQRKEAMIDTKIIQMGN